MITRYVALFLGVVSLASSPLHAAGNGKASQKEFPNCSRDLTGDDRVLINAMIAGRLLSTNDTTPQIVPATVTLQGDYFTWDVMHGGAELEHQLDERVVEAQVVRRRSGRPLVVFRDSDRLLELLPTAGWNVRVSLWGQYPLRSEQTSLDGRWLNESPRSNSLEYHGGVIGNVRVSTQMSQQPDGTILFRHIATLDDRPVPSTAGEILEIDDGRRFVFKENGNLRPIPSDGFARILAGRSSSDAINDAVASVHANLARMSAAPLCPALRELFEAESLGAVASGDRETRITALLGPVRAAERERWVLLIVPDLGRIVMPENIRGGDTIALEDGRLLSARDGFWWVKNDGGSNAAPSLAPPRPRLSRPEASTTNAE